MGLSLAEIREILQLYGKEDGGAAQNAKALRKFRERIVAFEQQKEDIDHAIAELREGCARIEAQLARVRPDLLTPDPTLGGPEPAAPRAAPGPARDLSVVRHA